MRLGTIIARLAGGMVMFLLGFGFYAHLFDDFFRANSFQYAGLNKNPPVIFAIFLFNVAWAWLIAWFFEKAHLNGWAQGAKIGAIMMFVLALGINLEFHAFMNIHKSIVLALVHILIVTFVGTVAGALIGLVPSYFSAKS